MFNKYRCIRCGYETSRLSNIHNHLKRINKCDPLLSDVDTKDQNIVNEIINICNFCGYNYKKYDNKEVHESSCSKKKEKEKEDILNKKLDTILTELNELKTKSTGNSTINNNINNNTYIENQNIDFKLLAYDDFTTRHIDREWLFNNIVENKNEMYEFARLFFKHTYLNDDVPENHSIFSVCIKKNSKDIYVYTDKQIISEISEDDFYKFINEDLKDRIIYLLKDREKIMITGNYNSFTEQEKEILSYDDYIEIRNSLTNFLSEKNNKYPEILNLLSKSNTSEYTIKELHKQKQHRNEEIFMPKNFKKYLERSIS
jgi:hypothetical protein